VRAEGVKEINLELHKWDMGEYARSIGDKKFQDPMDWKMSDISIDSLRSENKRCLRKMKFSSDIGQGI
jgi:hypothetical protein